MGLIDSRIVKKLFNPGEKTEGSNFMAIFVAVFVGCGGVLFGYDTGTINGVLAMKHVKETFTDSDHFSSSQTSLITSILSVGTFLGALTAPIASDTLGRRWALIISTFFFFNLGIILQVAATSIPLLCAGRAIAGFGVGMISSVVPLYQSEAAPKWIRGTIVSFYQWSITIGLLLASCVNQATHNRSDSSSYRIPIAIQFLFSLILGGGMIFLPDTPRFFIKKGDEKRAAESLSRLRKLPVDNETLLNELEEIKANHLAELHVTQDAPSWKNFTDCFSTENKQLKRILTGIFLQIFQQLTGINFIFYYGTQFFQKSGIKNPFIISLITNIVNVVATIPGILFVELFGRRKLLLTGAIGMTIADFIISIVGVATSSHSDVANNVMIAFVCVFIAFFAATWGPVAWVVVSEIFPLRLRAKSVAVTVAANWLFNFAIAYSTPYMVESGPGNANLGPKVFFIWGGCNLVAVFFTFFFIYETKGLSLEEVDQQYNSSVKPYSRKKLNFNNENNLSSNEKLQVTQTELSV